MPPRLSFGIELVVLAVSIACSQPDPMPGESVGDVIARVSGEPISALDLRVPPGAADGVHYRALDQAVLRSVAATEARRRGLNTRLEIAEKLLEIERDAVVREQMVLRDALFASIRDELALSEEALQAHYEATKLRYAERRLRVLRRPFDSREEAERALGEKGALDDPGTESLGPLGIQQLPRTVLPEALSLKDAGARAVAGSEEEGWSLIEVGAVTPAEPRPFEAVRREVEASLREREAVVKFRAVLDEVRAKADVQVDEDALARLSRSGKGKGQGLGPRRLSDRP